MLLYDLVSILFYDTYVFVAIELGRMHISYGNPCDINKTSKWIGRKNLGIKGKIRKYVVRGGRQENKERKIGSFKGY